VRQSATTRLSLTSLLPTAHVDERMTMALSPLLMPQGFAAREQALFPAHCIQSEVQRRGPGVDSEDREGAAHE